MNLVEIVGKYFNAGYYTVNQVKIFVVKGKITSTDFQTITGQVYA